MFDLLLISFFTVGDLSNVIKGASQKKKERERAENEREYGVGA